VLVEQQWRRISVAINKRTFRLTACQERYWEPRGGIISESLVLRRKTNPGSSSSCHLRWWYTTLNDLSIGAVLIRCLVAMAASR
jgi:hypothetical protein